MTKNISTIGAFNGPSRAKPISKPGHSGPKIGLPGCLLPAESYLT